MGRLFRISHAYARPCDKAVYMSYTREDRRTTDDPAKIPNYTGESQWWYKDGSNHRVVEGQIVRDLPDKGWMMQVENMEELLDLLRLYTWRLSEDEERPGEWCLHEY